MKIAFLTTEDPLYLPLFFGHVLPRLKPQHLIRVYAVPPLYKNQTSVQAARRYFKSFGAVATGHLVLRLVRARCIRQSVESVCQSEGVDCETISNVNGAEFLDQLRREQPDILVSVSCPQIFRRQLIDLPPKGVLNIHGSILPHYRGVMPSFWMLANGERSAGVSIYFVNEQIDAGELCGQEIFDICADETLDQFIRRSKQIAADLLLRTVAALDSGRIERRPLNLNEGSYYSWPDNLAVKRFRALGRRVW